MPTNFLLLKECTLKIRFVCLIVLLIFIISACTLPENDGSPTAVGGPTSVGGPTAVDGPTLVGGPTAVDIPTLVGGPTAVDDPTPVGNPTAVSNPTAPGDANNHCSLFDGSNFSIVVLDWQAGQPLVFYIKMPGGVPGLEKPIPGDNGPWNYSVNFGAYQTQDCKVEPGFPERLYCSINLPSEYQNSSQVLELYVNGCEASVYQNLQANVPFFSEQPTLVSGGGGSSCTLSCPASCEPDATCTACQGIGGGSCKP